MRFPLLALAFLLPSVPTLGVEPIHREWRRASGESLVLYDNGTQADFDRVEQSIVRDITLSLTNRCTGSPHYGTVTRVTHGTSYVKTECSLDCARVYWVEVTLTCRYRDLEAEQAAAAQETQALAAQESAARFCTSAAMSGQVLACTERGGTISHWGATGAVVNSSHDDSPTDTCPRSRLNGSLLSCDFGERGLHFFARTPAPAADAPSVAESTEDYAPPAAEDPPWSPAPPVVTVTPAD